MSDSGPGETTAGSGGGDQPSAVHQFRKVAASDPDLQQQLAAAESEDEFHDKAVALGAERGYSFTADESRAHVAETKRVRAMANESGGGGGTNGCSLGHTCEKTCTWNPYDKAC
jgi:Nif11 domain